MRPNGLLATAIRNTGESETAAVKEMTRERARVANPEAPKGIADLAIPETRIGSNHSNAHKRRTY